MTTSPEQWPPQCAGRQIYGHLNVEAVARQECKHVIVSSKNINYAPLAQHVPPPALHCQAGPQISSKTQTESFKNLVLHLSGLAAVEQEISEFQVRQKISPLKEKFPLNPLK